MQKYKVRILLSFFAFLLAFNIFTFPKRASANPLVILGGIAITSEISYALGTALLTFGGYAAIQSPRGQAVLDSVANGLVSLGTSGIQIAEDGTAFISNKAMDLIDNLINSIQKKPYNIGNMGNLLSNNGPISQDGYSFPYSLKLTFKDFPYSTYKNTYWTLPVNGRLFFKQYGNTSVTVPVEKGRGVRLWDGYDNQGLPSQYYVQIFEYNGGTYSAIDNSYVIGYNDISNSDLLPAFGNDFVGQDVFPNSYERDRADAGVVLKPKAKDLDITNTYEDWLNPSLTYDVDSISNVIDVGEGSISNDGVLEHNLPVDTPVDTPFDFGLSFDALWEWLQSILDAILSIPQSIADFIEYLFIPTISLSEALTYDSNFITQFGNLFDFSFLGNISVTPPNFILDFDMNGVEGSSVPVYVDYNMERNKFLSDNINIIRNITTLPLLFSVLFGIIWHFTPKREVD